MAGIQSKMNFIQQTCNQIVVPPKLKYSMLDLGYAISNSGRRHDSEVKNQDNETLKVSLYVPKESLASRACVVYLHSMNGSRLECLAYVENMMSSGYHVCSFDFSGCGASEGNSISFGANEKHDVHAVLEHLREKHGIGKVILWGRSMGAVACIKYCQMRATVFSQVQILGVVLDSPFESLKRLIIELGAKRTDLPNVFVHAFYHLIKSTLQRKGGFEMEDLQLINSMKNLRGVPILFLVSKQDTTIDASHSESLYRAYSHWEKKLVYFSGLHNEARDQEYIGAVHAFLEERLKGSQHAGRENYENYKKISVANGYRGGFDGEVQMTQQCTCSIFR